jgi:hypothetical protein
MVKDSTAVFLVTRSRWSSHRAPGTAGHQWSPAGPAAASRYVITANYAAEVIMVEGKGFNDSPARNIANLRDAILQNAAKRGRPRPTASQSPPRLPSALDT